QAYGDASTMLRESLVRVCVVRYLKHFDGPTAEQAALQKEKGRGFLWISELSDALAEYETRRDQYPNLETFAPRLIASFKDYAATFEQKQAAIKANQPKVVSIKPANGAQDIEAGATKIEVVFDRPMRDKSWSLVGGGPHFPETAGQPSYDAR